MNTTYVFILGLLLLLAVLDLVVGVSNDAANFLNSAVGCKAAKRWVILSVAAVGVIVGASFSGGMMEIARSGVFVPSQFSFHEVMILLTAVMLTDVILLDIFNTFGLPTSTTVSLVFELLGSALAVSLCIIMRRGDSIASVSDYINSSSTLSMIAGIFCSVGVAFTCGCAVMGVSRLIFSFHYQRAYRWIGAAWCALALTAITYFAVFKGLKHSTLVAPQVMAWLQANMGTAVACSLGIWYAIALSLQHIFRINVLRFTVLAGTCALALAFAGNDLVNFIGVFMAAESSFQIAQDFVSTGGDLSTLKMGALASPVQAHAAWLIGAGLIMVAALFFSKKARTVTETEIKLARSSGGAERFGSCAPARAAVRFTIQVIHFISRLTPAPVRRFVASRFEPLRPEEEEDHAFDLIRGSVNLTVASLLISLATSLRLPLSTTYVTFMVAMGSSLADRAWSRDSAVYRITGVLAVIGGWFLTGLGALFASFIIAGMMITCGIWGVCAMVLLAGFVLVKSAILHHLKTAKRPQLLSLTNAGLRDVGVASADRLGRILGIYTATVQALLHEDRTALKRLRKKARDIVRTLRAVKEDALLPALKGADAAMAQRGQMVFRIMESCIGIAESLRSITQASFNHIDNAHVGLDAVQARELLDMSNRVASFFPGLIVMLESGDYTPMQRAMASAGDLSEQFAEAITRQLLRHDSDESNMRTHILFLNLLNETRAMVRKSFSLLKEQQELFEER